MDPVAFNLFGMEVRWYGVIISAAMIIGVLLAIRNGKNFWNCKLPKLFRN